MFHGCANQDCVLCDGCVCSCLRGCRHSQEQLLAPTVQEYKGTEENMQTSRPTETEVCSETSAPSLKLY
jgi:hypothetical protein